MNAFARTAAVLLLCLIFPACSNRIPENRFTDILAEIYLSKAWFSSEGIIDACRNDTVAYNRYIVERHGYQWEQFDSTLSWYCANPRRFQDIHDEIIARFSEMEKQVSDELDPPEELWKNAPAHTVAGREQDSLPVSVLLKGSGKYLIKAKIQLYPHDESVNPRIALYWWRTDTTAAGRYDTCWIQPLSRNSLPVEYSIERQLLPGNEFTHLKGCWLKSSQRQTDTTWNRNVRIGDISIIHIPQKFE
ncbi:MAG: DUF4296 domain-containing protein [Bacteroidales bacterium]|nr:DUF4296 domain-containing protein [Bacteroidales bacterium]